MKARRSLGALLCFAMCGQAHAATNCLTDKEFENVALSVAPIMLASARGVCSSVLPSQSFLMNRSSPMATSLEAAAGEAWVTARPAFIRFMRAMGTPVAAEEERMSREELEAGMKPLLVNIIKPSDCEFTSRMIELVQPLPARNMAGILVELLHKTQAGKTGTAADPLAPICPR